MEQLNRNQKKIMDMLTKRTKKMYSAEKKISPEDEIEEELKK